MGRGRRCDGLRGSGTSYGEGEQGRGVLVPRRRSPVVVRGLVGAVPNERMILGKLLSIRGECEVFVTFEQLHLDGDIDSASTSRRGEARELGTAPCARERGSC